MAAPRKENLDYFPFDVGFFADKKIKRLRAKFGNDGICVLIYIYTQIYAEGFYIPYDEDLILDISDELNITENLTRQIFAYLFSRAMLDGNLAESVKVITAASIQRRWQEAKKRLQRDIPVQAEYWLLPPEETLGFIWLCGDENKSAKNSDKSAKNDSNSAKNDTKESKVKESKVKEIISAGFSDAVGSALIDWIQYKSEKGQTYKPKGMSELIGKMKSEVKSRGDAAVVAGVRDSMANGYAGIYFNRNQASEPAQPASYDINRAEAKMNQPPKLKKKENRHD